jgi:hypothetical protein
MIPWYMDNIKTSPGPISEDGAISIPFRIRADTVEFVGHDLGELSRQLIVGQLPVILVDSPLRGDIPAIKEMGAVTV